MKGKHTPEPWETRRFTEQGDTAIAQVGYMPHATIYPRGSGGTASPAEVETADANARLIAAAPNLLNACIAALSQLTEDRAEYLESDIKQLKEAIALAGGEPDDDAQSEIDRVCQGRTIHNSDGTDGPCLIC